jgi:hypothetical protein
MARSDDAAGPDEEAPDLSLQEAAALYDVSLATLRKRVRSGQILAYKARGPWGHEWRVTRRALEAFGYQPRPSVPADELSTDERVVSLERELAAIRRVVSLEKQRADQADRELGHLMLEMGRLRTALSRAQREAAAERSRCRLEQPCSTPG